MCAGDFPFAVKCAASGLACPSPPSASCCPGFWLLSSHSFLVGVNIPLPSPILSKKLLFACSLLSFTEDLVLVIFKTLAAIPRANMARDREVRAQMTYHFLQHLDQSGFENVSYLRQKFNDYKETIEEAAKLEPVRKTFPNIKYLG